MFFQTKSRWGEIGYTNERHIYFVQTWRELLSKRTYISWQVKTSNTKSLASELLYNVEVVNEYSNAIDNLAPIIEEIQDRYCQERTIIDKINPLFANCLDRLKKIDKKCDNIKQIYRLTCLLNLGLESYRCTVFEEIEHILNSESESKYKKSLYTYISGLLTELISTGYSYAFLERLLDNFNEATNQPFMQSFILMKDRLNKGDLEFNCTYEFRSKPEYFDSYKALGAISEPSETTGNRLDFDLDAKDIHSAVILARNKITKIEHVVALYYELSSIDNKFSQVQIRSCDPSDEKINEISFTNRSIFNTYDTYGYRNQKSQNNQIRNYLERVLESLLNNVGTPVMEGIYSSLNSYNQSIIATTDEMKFTNLWVAFEALIQTIGGSTKNIMKDRLPAILSVNYIPDLVKDAAITLRKFYSHTQPNSDATNFLDPLIKNREKVEFEFSGIFNLLEKPEKYFSGQENNNEINYNPLLCYRISTLNEWFLSPKALANKLNAHIRTLRLQLLRIYRMRNFILHKATIPHEIKLLTTHLDYYYQITINIILTTLIKYPELSIADCLEYANLKVQGLIDFLNEDSPNPYNYEKIEGFSLPISEG